MPGSVGGRSKGYGWGLVAGCVNTSVPRCGSLRISAYAASVETGTKVERAALVGAVNRRALAAACSCLKAEAQPVPAAPIRLYSLSRRATVATAHMG